MRRKDEQRERSHVRIELMRAVQRGDRDAYRVLIDDLRPFLERLARRGGVAADDVADVRQDCLVALHRARHTYRPPRPVEPWLAAIARRIVQRHHERRVARLAREVPVGELPERAGTLATPDAARLRAAVERLPARQREAFEMLQLEGLSVREAAARAGTTSGALRVRAHRAYRSIVEWMRR